MKITLQTLKLAIRNWSAIRPLYKTLSDKKFNANWFNGRHLLWLRPTYEGLFTPDSTVPMVARILNKHYGEIRDRFSAPVITALSVDRGVLVYQHGEDKSLQVFLKSASHNSKEGELYLLLWKDNVRLFRMGFVVVDENSIFDRNEVAILITHIQGYRDRKELVREATKQFLDISLDRILLSTLIGFASYLRIKRLYGIPYELQYTFTSRDKTKHEAFFKDNYDAFFSRFQPEMDHGYFSLPLPLQSKPLETLKHKKRTELRRKLNLHIGDCVCDNLVRMNRQGS